MTIIKIKSLGYTYPTGVQPAFKDVSIKINRGEFVILTGPSGCGKTTLCRCLNGLIPHFYGGNLEGEIRILGLKVNEHPIHELAKHVGMVFQNPENQLFALTVEKDISFGLENLGISRKEMREKVNWALDVTGISDLKERAPYEISGGQQQRVAIASVLAMQPEIMVLDEPTSFLDPLGACSIFDVVGHLNKELGITILLVEHRLDLIAKYASRVIVMDKGRVILDGEPREILSSEKARIIGVGIPKVTRLYQLLKAEKFELEDIPLCSDEAYKLIKKAFGK